MADSDFEDEKSPYLARRDRVMSRFIELGGGKGIDEDLRTMPTIADHITDVHRQLVSDLVAQGLPNGAVASIVGISKERLQTLFAAEIESAYHIASSSLKRNLFRMGMSGDTGAMTKWISMHNLGDWAEKREMTDKGAEQEAKVASEMATAGQDLVAKAIAYISTSKEYQRPASKEPPPAPAKIAPEKVSRVSYNKRVRKPKQET